MDAPGSHAANVLFSTNQQRMLRALFSDLAPPEGYAYAELLRLTNAGAGGLHRELKQFQAAGLVREQRIGGRRFYVANPEHPVHEELRSIARKLLGIPSVLSEALSPLREDIEEAFIYGSIAKQTETAESDVDVIVVGDCDYARLLGALQPLDALLRRHVSVRLYAPDEYRRLVRSDSFLKKVDEGPQITLIGTPARPGTFGSSRPLPVLIQANADRNETTYRKSALAPLGKQEIDALVDAADTILKAAKKKLLRPAAAKPKRQK